MWTCYAAGMQKRNARCTADAKATPSIGSGAGWSWHQNASTTAVRNASKGLFELVTPYREVGDAWSAKESVQDIYQIGDPHLAAEFTQQLSGDLQDRSLPPEVNRLGRTISRCATQITNWRHSAVTNGPTEGLNNLIKWCAKPGLAPDPWGESANCQHRVQHWAERGLPGIAMIWSCLISKLRHLPAVWGSPLVWCPPAAFPN